jgi:hypothetical protein
MNPNEGFQAECRKAILDMGKYKEFRAIATRSR